MFLGLRGFLWNIVRTSTPRFARFARPQDSASRRTERIYHAQIIDLSHRGSIPPTGSQTRPPGLPIIPNPIYQPHSTNALHDYSHQALTKEIGGIFSKMTIDSLNRVRPASLIPNQPIHCHLHQPQFVLAPAGNIEGQTRMRSSLLGNMTPCR